jgi:hypothetical protein
MADDVVYEDAIAVRSEKRQIYGRSGSGEVGEFEAGGELAVCAFDGREARVSGRVTIQ